MSPRTRGNRQGSVRRIGQRFQLRYKRRDGSRVEVMTDAMSKNDALNLLNREMDREWGRPGVVKTTLVSDLCKLATTEGGSDIAKRWKNLKTAFGSLKAADLTTEMLHAYIATRRTEDAANATINRELAALRRMFNLGKEATPQLVREVPSFPSLSEKNVRRGFFDLGDMAALLPHLPAHLRPLAVVAFWTGWRRGELVNLTWSQLNLTTGEARLHPGTTKNDEGRVIFLPAPALAAVCEWRKVTRAFERKSGTIVQHVFHKDGKPVPWYHKEWNVACGKAGLSGRMLHDMRRSATRNMIRTGVPDVVAMKITGHKTRSIFDRYNIVSESDLRLAAEQVATLTQRYPAGGTEQPKRAVNRRRKA